MRVMAIGALTLSTALTVFAAPGWAQGQGVAGSYLAARQAVIDGDHREAATYFERAMRADPDNLALRNNAVLARAALGDWDDALAVAARIPMETPGRDLANIVEQVDRIRNGEVSAALEAIDNRRGAGPLVDDLARGWLHLGDGDFEAGAAILRDLAKAYPNITAIRVRDAIDRVADVLGGLAAATSYGALATLLTGFLVLIGAAAAGSDARTYESAMLKTLGASRRAIAASFILRAALLGLCAGLVALVAGALAGWAVSTYVMETDFSVIWSSALLIIAGGIAATVLAGLGFALRALNARPARVLRARE